MPPTKPINATRIMSAENKNCLINESACGRIDGNPVCPKCGMDERVVYPGEDDLRDAQRRAGIRFCEMNKVTPKMTIDQIAAYVGAKNNETIERLRVTKSDRLCEMNKVTSKMTIDQIMAYVGAKNNETIERLRVTKLDRLKIFTNANAKNKKTL